MRFEKVRENVDVFNKVNNECYRIVNVEDNRAIAKRVLDSKECLDWRLQELSEDDVIVITPGNSIAFRMIHDYNAHIVFKDVSLEDGQLMRNGKNMTEQGELRFKRVLPVECESIILLISENGFLYMYNAEFDTFTRCSTLISPDTAEVAAYVKESGIIAIMDSLEISEDNEDQDEEDSKIFTKGRTEILLLNMKLRNANTATRITLPIIPCQEKEIVSYRNELYIPFKKELNEEDRNDSLYFSVKENEKIDYFVIDLVHNNENTNRKLGINDVLKEVNTSYIESGSRVFITEHGFKYKDMFLQADELDILQTYRHLVDLTRDGCDYRFSFANDKCDVKTIISRKTKDRGFIVSVE